MNQQNYNGNKQLYLIAYVFSIVGTVITCWIIIPMIWTIPMTLMTKKAHDECGTVEETQHIALGICSLLFMGLVAGILILIASSESNHNQFNPNNNQNQFQNNNNNQNGDDNSVGQKTE